MPDELTLAAFGMFRRRVKIGVWVVVESRTAEGTFSEASGTVADLDDGGVLLEQSSGEMQYIPASTFFSFRIPGTVQAKATSATVDSSAEHAASPKPGTDEGPLLSMAPSTSSHPAERSDVASPAVPTILEAVHQRTADARPKHPPARVAELVGAINADVLLHLRSQLEAPPLLRPPAPTFRFSDLSYDDAQDIIRWKNKYDYAAKIGELFRVRDAYRDITPIARRLNSAALYRLAATLSLAAVDSVTAKSLFIEAHRLGDFESGVALAAIDVGSSHFSSAASYLIRALTVATAHMESSIEDSRLADIALQTGRCCARTQEGVEGLGDLYLACLNRSFEPVLRIAVLTQLPSNAEHASQALLSGDFNTARIASESASLWRPLAPVHASDVERMQGETPTTTSGYRQTSVVGVSRDTRTKPAKNDSDGSGSIVDYNSFTRYGEIQADSGELLSFYKEELSDRDLLNQLAQGELPIKVDFRFGKANRTRRFRPAWDIRRSGAPSQPIVQQVVRTTFERPLRPKGVNETAQSKASRALALAASGNFTEAEKIYREEIAAGGLRRKGAIKDLAHLLRRVAVANGDESKTDEAVELLRAHRAEFGADTRSVDNSLATILSGARRFAEAAEVWTTLRETATTEEQRLNAYRAEATNRWAAGEIAEADKLLSQILRRRPTDFYAQELAKRIRESKLRPAEQATGDMGTIAFEEFEAFASGFSRVARFFLANCEYQGLDEAARRLGTYEERHFAGIENAYRRQGGRRPRELAEFSLTLAAMCRDDPGAAAGRSPFTYLRQFFLYKAEVALGDRAPLDTVRFFALEALRLSEEDASEPPINFIVNSHLSSPVATYELVAKNLRDLAPLLADSPTHSQQFLQAVPYYTIFSPWFARRISDNLRSYPPLFASMERGRVTAGKREQEDRVAKELASLDVPPNYRLSTIASLIAATTSVAETTLFALDRSRLQSLVSLLEEFSVYLSDTNYTEKESKLYRLQSRVGQTRQTVVEAPTSLSIERIMPLLDYIDQSAKERWQEFVAESLPDIEVLNILENDNYTLDPIGWLSLALGVRSAPNSAPVEDLSLVFAADSGLDDWESPQFSGWLRGGERRELLVRVKPAPFQIQEQAFALRCKLEFRLPDGDLRESQWHSLPIRLSQSDDFVELDNPYTPYASGKPAVDPNMFFGRRELIRRIAEQLNTGPVGQCYVLYGQKRSGKSSIAEHLVRTLAEQSAENETGEAVLPILCSVGMVFLDRTDPNSAMRNFTRVLVRKLGEKLQESHGGLPSGWPTDADLNADPATALLDCVARIRSIVSDSEGRTCRVVFFIDEFTYWYEYLADGIIPVSFMRFWKALIESRAFNAVIIGQDSMPKFKQAFPNEFNVTHDERVTYLSDAAGRELAEVPILLNGKTRYRGQALDTLIRLTAANPYFLQKMCDGLVQHMNRRRANWITEPDVQAVAEQFIRGDRRLTEADFDSLTTVAGDSVALAPREEYLSILTAIAARSTASRGASLTELPQLARLDELVRDMTDREVLLQEGPSQWRIRVGLFAEWLRANRSVPGSST